MHTEPIDDRSVWIGRDLAADRRNGVVRLDLASNVSYSRWRVRGLGARMVRSCWPFGL